MNRVLNTIKKCGIINDGLEKILNNTVNFYRIYFIPKKSIEGKRMICAPSEGMLSLQYAILPLIKRMKVSKASAAYEKGCSPKKNAKIHKKINLFCIWILKTFLLQ
jgi:hypothetical protein